MKTWNDYKAHVDDVDPEISKDLKEAEEAAAILIAASKQRTALQHELKPAVLQTKPMG